MKQRPVTLFSIQSAPCARLSSRLCYLTPLPHVVRSRAPASAKDPVSKTICARCYTNEKKTSGKRMILSICDISSRLEITIP